MLCFGSVTYKNFNGDLRNVANVAENSKNQNVRVQILRNGQVIMTSSINKKKLYLFKNTKYICSNYKTYLNKIKIYQVQTSPIHQTNSQSQFLSILSVEQTGFSIYYI